MKDSLSLRTSKRLQILEKEVDRLTRLLKATHQQCFNCSEFIPPQSGQFKLETSKGVLCEMCLLHDENALDGIKASHHDLSIFSGHLYPIWQACAPAILKCGKLPDSRQQRNRILNALILDSLTWDLCEDQHGKAPDKLGASRQPLFFDPRKFRVQNDCLECQTS